MSIMICVFFRKQLNLFYRCNKGESGREEEIPLAVERRMILKSRRNRFQNSPEKEWTENKKESIIPQYHGFSLPKTLVKRRRRSKRGLDLPIFLKTIGAEHIGFLKFVISLDGSRPLLHPHPRSVQPRAAKACRVRRETILPVSHG